MLKNTSASTERGSAKKERRLLLRAVVTEGGARC